MGTVIFNGISSKDYGIQVEHPPEYAYPQRDYNIQHVPGRNGDVVLDEGSYQNVLRTYDLAIGSYKEDFIYLANRISEWLHSASGYARLEDSYEPDYYRMAFYEDAGEIENIYRHAGRITVNFNCKPQRFLKSGDRAVAFSGTGNIYNPTRCYALPIITVKGTGSGVLQIGNYNISISSIGGAIIIDSSIQDCYFGTSNKNSVVAMNDKGYPQLLPGINTISFTGGITSVEVVPKWWTL